MLRPDIFQQITTIWGKPSIDLFASRLNAQLPCYASWKPDPNASYVGALSISWERKFFYVFPPFSLIPRCLQKIQMETAEGIMIVPMWPTQPWYSQLLHMILDVPRILPQQVTTLRMPGREHETHLLSKKMFLMACKLSGNHLQHKEFLRKLETSSYSHGDKALVNNTPHTSRGGLHIVINNMLIVFLPLFPTTIHRNMGCWKGTQLPSDNTQLGEHHVEGFNVENCYVGIISISSKRPNYSLS